MENVYLTSKESMANEPEENRSTRQDETPKSKETLAKFHQIIRHYLQEEIDHPSDLIQSILGSYSLAAYLEHTVVTGRDNVVANLLSQCSSSLQGLFQVSNSTCFVHEEPATGIIHLLQMRLLHLYPKYSTQGYEALYSCPPTIYISPLCIPSLGNMICRKLGFPSSCVKVLRMTDEELPKLEKSLQEDLAAKRIPVMLIASIGSHHNGSVDNLLAIASLAQRFNMWLHLEGHLISKLSLLDHHKEALMIADSLHLDLRLWLGIPSLPFVTLYRQCETALQKAACLTPASCSTFTVVPLWFTLQMNESSGIKERFRAALELSETLAKHLSVIENIQILSYAPPSSLTESDDSKWESIEQPVESKAVDIETSEAVVESEQHDVLVSDVEGVEVTEPTVSEETVEAVHPEKNNESQVELEVEEAEEVKEAEEAKEADEAEEVDEAVESDKSIDIQKNDEKNESNQSSLAGKMADEENEELETIDKDDDTEASDLDQDAPSEVKPEEEPQPPKDEKSRPQALMETVCPVVVFQYQPKAKGTEIFSANIIDDLNLWLAQVLERSCDVVHIDVIDVDQSGYALRFSPYDSLAFPAVDDLKQFLSIFDQQIEILNATVDHKATLFEITEQSPELQLVELPGWAGLGGVRYLPAAWRSNLVEQLPDQGKEEINKINRQLVATLKLTDSAFSLGEGSDGLACVRFGMVVVDTDVPALANLVRQTGLDIEASTQELETMAVLVRKGIEEAQAELQKETEQQLWDEGLIRHIPVVGSLVNYFLPTQKTVRIHGYVLQPDKKQPHDNKLEVPVAGSSGTPCSKDVETLPILFTIKQAEGSGKCNADSNETAGESELQVNLVPCDSQSPAIVKPENVDLGQINLTEKAVVESNVPEDLDGSSGVPCDDSYSQSSGPQMEQNESIATVLTSALEQDASLEPENKVITEPDSSVGTSEPTLSNMKQNVCYPTKPEIEVNIVQADAQEENKTDLKASTTLLSNNSEENDFAPIKEDSSHQCEEQETVSIESTNCNTEANKLAPESEPTQSCVNEGNDEAATLEDAVVNHEVTETIQPSDENNQVSVEEQSKEETTTNTGEEHQEVAEPTGLSETNDKIRSDEPLAFKEEGAQTSCERECVLADDPLQNEAPLLEIVETGNEELLEVEELRGEGHVSELQTVAVDELVDKSEDQINGEIPDVSNIEESIVNEIRKMDERMQTQIELQLNLTALVKKAFGEITEENPLKGETETNFPLDRTLEPKATRSIIKEIEKIDERLQKQIELQLNLASLVKNAVGELKSHAEESHEIDLNLPVENSVDVVENAPIDIEPDDLKNTGSKNAGDSSGCVTEVNVSASGSTNSEANHSEIATQETNGLPELQDNLPSELNVQESEDCVKQDNTCDEVTESDAPSIVNEEEEEESNAHTEVSKDELITHAKELEANGPEDPVEEKEHVLNLTAESNPKISDDCEIKQDCDESNIRISGDCVNQDDTCAEVTETESCDLRSIVNTCAEECNEHTEVSKDEFIGHASKLEPNACEDAVEEPASVSNLNGDEATEPPMTEAVTKLLGDEPINCSVLEAVDVANLNNPDGTAADIQVPRRELEITETPQKSGNSSEFTTENEVEKPGELEQAKLSSEDHDPSAGVLVPDNVLTECPTENDPVKTIELEQKVVSEDEGIPSGSVQELEEKQICEESPQIKAENELEVGTHLKEECVAAVTSNEILAEGPSQDCGVATSETLSVNHLMESGESAEQLNTQSEFTVEPAAGNVTEESAHPESMLEGENTPQLTPKASEITGDSIGDVQESETRTQSITPVNVGDKMEEEQVVEADLSDLAQMVQNSQAEFETPTVDLKDMAQIVQKGIEEAQADLQREIELQVWQEGLIRHIPVVGPLYNFFSPAPKADIKGRTLNLQKGRVEKSEVPAPSATNGS